MVDALTQKLLIYEIYKIDVSLCVLLLSLSFSTKIIYLLICITLLIYFVKIFSGTGRGLDSFVRLRLFHPIGGHHYIPGHHFIPICT
jgi:hypothetical protein